MGRRWLAQSSVSLEAGCLVTFKKHYLQWQGAHRGEELSGMEEAIADSGFRSLVMRTGAWSTPCRSGSLDQNVAWGTEAAYTRKPQNGKARQEGVPDQSVVKVMGDSVHTLFLDSEKPRFASTQTFSPEHRLS